MKKDHLLLLVALFAMAYLLFFVQKASQVQSLTNVFDSITVYGNVHLLPLDLVPLELQEDKARVQKTQKWLYQEIKEDVVLVEGASFLSGRQTSENIYGPMGEVNDLQKRATEYFAVQFDTGIRFIFENQKEVYGCENDSLYHLAYDSAKADPYFVRSPEFDKLNDLRNEKIAKNARFICAQTHKRIAIIIGQRHLTWFQDHGYRVKYPPEY